MRKKTKGILLGLLTLVLCILIFCERITGDIVHALSGILLGAVLLVHSARNKKKMNYKSKAVRTVDWILMGTIILLPVTGVLLHPLNDVLIIKLLHKLAAVVFLLACMVHVLQHCMMKKDQKSNGE